MNKISIPTLHGRSVWVFCRVIDNFGDAGVAWRLAAELHRASAATVYLYIDHLPTLTALNPDIDPHQSTQSASGVKVCRWDENLSLPRDNPPVCVIEMFACELPAPVRDIIRAHRPLWLNWEYLSAEAWTETMHLLPSPQPDGCEKFFYLMGFSEASGGLIRDQRSESDRQSASDLHCSPQKNNRPMADSQCLQSDACRLYLFGYAAPVWADWLRCWQDLARPLRISVAGEQIEQVWRQAGLMPQDDHDHTNAVWHVDQIAVQHAPFVAQSEFDTILRAANVVVVRGEDSFVRAQYAGVPFFWQIYAQENGVHHGKLHAFWDKVYPYFPPELIAPHRALSNELNGVQALSTAERRCHWQTLLDGLPAWTAALQRWRTHLHGQPDAVEKLISLIVEKRLK